MSILSVNIARLSSYLRTRSNEVLGTYYPLLSGKLDNIPTYGQGVLNVVDTQSKVNWTICKDSVDNTKLKINAYAIDGQTSYDNVNDSFSDISDETTWLREFVVDGTVNTSEEALDMLDVAVTDTQKDISVTLQDALQKQVQYGNLEGCMSALLEQYRSVDEVTAAKLAMICDQYTQYKDDDVTKLKADILQNSGGDSVSAFSIFSIIKESMTNIRESAAANDVKLPEDKVFKYETLFDFFSIGQIIQGLGAVLTAVGKIVVRIIGLVITVAGWLISQIKKVVQITEASYNDKVKTGYWNFYLYKGTLPSTSEGVFDGLRYRRSDGVNDSADMLLWDQFGNKVMYALDIGGVTTYQWFDNDGNINITGYVYNCFDPIKFSQLLCDLIPNRMDIENASATFGGYPYLERYVGHQSRIYKDDWTRIFNESRFGTVSETLSAGTNYLASLALSAAYYGLMCILRANNNQAPTQYFDFCKGIWRQQWDNRNQKWDDVQQMYDLDDEVALMAPYMQAMAKIIQVFQDNSATPESVVSTLNSIGSDFIQDVDTYRVDDLSGYDTMFTSWCLDLHGWTDDPLPLPIAHDWFGIGIFPSMQSYSRKPFILDLNSGILEGNQFVSYNNGSVGFYVTDCYPTKFTYSAPLVSKDTFQRFLVTVGVIIGVVATVAIASSVIKFKLRRSVEYGGTKQLNDAKTKWSNGELTDKEFRKSVRGYNRRARLLGLRTYDPINGWFDYADASSASAAISDTMANFGFGESDDPTSPYDGTVDAPNGSTTYAALTQATNNANTALTNLTSYVNDTLMPLLQRINDLIK